MNADTALFLAEIARLRAVVQRLLAALPDHQARGAWVQRARDPFGFADRLCTRCGAEREVREQREATG